MKLRLIILFFTAADYTTEKSICIRADQFTDHLKELTVFGTRRNSDAIMLNPRSMSQTQEFVMMRENFYSQC